MTFELGSQGTGSGRGGSMNRSSVLGPDLSVCIFLCMRGPRGPQILRDVLDSGTLRNHQPIRRSQCVLLVPLAVCSKGYFW